MHPCCLCTLVCGIEHVPAHIRLYDHAAAFACCFAVRNTVQAPLHACRSGAMTWMCLVGQSGSCTCLQKRGHGTQVGTVSLCCCSAAAACPLPVTVYSCCAHPFGPSFSAHVRPTGKWYLFPLAPGHEQGTLSDCDHFLADWKSPAIVGVVLGALLIAVLACYLMIRRAQSLAALDELKVRLHGHACMTCMGTLA